jgi:hypothetical protein
MRRTFIATAVATLTTFGVASTASAQEVNQPSQGEESTGRNEAGFGGGPHCHVMRNSHGAPFEWIRVFPSHQGHASSGTADGPFLADPDCDGDPG